MGRTRLIPLVIKTKRTGEFYGEWKTRTHGKPTAENLGKWRDQFNQSLLPGGCNEHIGTKGWLQCTLQIIDQRSKTVAAEYQSPMFEVIP